MEPFLRRLISSIGGLRKRKTMSADDNNAWRLLSVVAPAFLYSSSAIPMEAPKPASIITWARFYTKRSTEEGIKATRCSP